MTSAASRSETFRSTTRAWMARSSGPPRPEASQFLSRRPVGRSSSPSGFLALRSRHGGALRCGGFSRRPTHTAHERNGTCVASCMARSAAVGSRGSRDGFAVRASSALVFRQLTGLFRETAFVHVFLILRSTSCCCLTPIAPQVLQGTESGWTRHSRPHALKKKGSTRCDPHSQDMDASSPPERHLQSSQS